MLTKCWSFCGALSTSNLVCKTGLGKRKAEMDRKRNDDSILPRIRSPSEMPWVHTSPLFFLSLNQTGEMSASPSDASAHTSTVEQDSEELKKMFAAAAAKGVLFLEGANNPRNIPNAVFLVRTCYARWRERVMASVLSLRDAVHGQRFETLGACICHVRFCRFYQRRAPTRWVSLPSVFSLNLRCSI